MRHHHHGIRSANPQLRNARIPQSHHPIRIRKPLHSRQLPAPIRHRNVPPQQRSHTHHRLRIIPRAQHKQSLRPSHLLHKPSFIFLTRAKPSRTSQLLLTQTLACKHNHPIAQHHPPQTLPIPRQIRHHHRIPPRKRLLRRIHQGPALRSIRRLQQQIHHATTPEPKRNLSRIIEHRRVALHHSALPHHPPGLANHLRLKTSPTDRPRISPIRTQQQPSPRPPITRSLSPHQRHQHRGPTPPPKPNDLPPLHHPLSLILHPLPLSSRHHAYRSSARPAPKKQPGNKPHLPDFSPPTNHRKPYANINFSQKKYESRTLIFSRPNAHSEDQPPLPGSPCKAHTRYSCTPDRKAPTEESPLFPHT